MRIKKLSPLLFGAVLCVACGKSDSSDKDASQDSGDTEANVDSGDTDTDEPNPEDLQVSTSGSECVTYGGPDTGNVDPTFTASSSAPGTADVEQTGVSASCCLTLVPSVALNTDGSLQVTYAEEGEPCDCMCLYDVSYSIINAESGPTTIHADGRSVEVEIQ